VVHLGGRRHVVECGLPRSGRNLEVGRKNVETSERIRSQMTPPGVRWTFGEVGDGVRQAACAPCARRVDSLCVPRARRVGSSCVLHARRMDFP
jgi:hypothetical protein